MTQKPLDFKINPINARDVALSFERKWCEFGNDSSGSLLDLWTVICQHFNKIYINNHNNLPKKYFNIPAPTGSGKTQIFKHYISELIKQNSDIGVLIVTRYKSEADEAVNDINNWSNKPYIATAYYSDSSINRNELYKFNNKQVAVITHENYIRNHNTNSVNHNIYKQIATFNNKGREIVIIDEEVNLINHIGIDKRAVSSIESSLNILVSRTKNSQTNLELKLVRYLHNNYDTLFYQEHKHKRLINNKHLLLNKVSTELEITTDETIKLFELQNLKESIKSGELLVINPALDTKKIDIYAQNIKYLLDDKLYEYNTGYSYEYRTSTLEYPNKSITILNATANPNSIGIPDAITVKLPKVKTYEQVRLFKVKTSEKYLGKEVFNKLDSSGSEEDKFNTIPENLINFADFGCGDKTALFTHKDIRNKLRIKDDNATVDHFGNLLGVNRYRDCKNVIIYGIQIKPRYIYIDVLINLIGVNALLEENKGRLTDIQYDDISVDIVQEINRGRCRGIENSKAPKMDVYLLIPNNKKLSQKIISFIKELMPDIQILDSVLEYNLSSFSKEKPKSRDEDFINAIDTGRYEILAKEIKGSLGISKKIWERMLKHLTKPEYSNSFLSVSVRTKGYKTIKKGKSYYLTKI